MATPIILRVSHPSNATEQEELAFTSYTPDLSNNEKDTGAVPSNPRMLRELAGAILAETVSCSAKLTIKSDGTPLQFSPVQPLSRRNTRDSAISVSSYRSIASNGSRNTSTLGGAEASQDSLLGKNDAENEDTALFDCVLQESGKPVEEMVIRRKRSGDLACDNDEQSIPIASPNDETIEHQATPPSPLTPPTPVSPSTPSLIDPTSVTPVGDTHPSTALPEPSDDAAPSFNKPRPFSNSSAQPTWRPLHDDDGWSNTHPWSAGPGGGDQTHVSASSAVSSLNRSSSSGSPWQNGYLSSSRRVWNRRPACRRAGLIATLAVIVCATMLTIIVLVAKLNNTDPFNKSAGARGGVPMAPPGPPLPVMLGAMNGSDTPSGTYFGISIDWNTNDPQSFNTDFGRNAAIQDNYFDIGAGLGLVQTVNSSGYMHQVPDYFDWTSDLIMGTGAIMGITLMPSQGLGNVSMAAITALGVKCKQINDKGVPIMLRFAPEMNGNWYAWGQDPVEYVRIFRLIASTVHNMTGFDPQQPGAAPLNGTDPTLNTTIAANGTMLVQNRAYTAMVWAPAAAQRYPFNDTTSRFAPAWNTSRWLALDTNKDGKIDEEDDPYSPYYPGDDFVDWIGISAPFYGPAVNNTKTNATVHFNSSLPTASDSAFLPSVGATTMASNVTYVNVLPPVGTDYDDKKVQSPSFEGIITGYGTRWNLYKDWVKAKGMPMVISETAYGYYINGVGVDELAGKGTWWRSVYNSTVLKAYPLIRGVIWYDKVATEYGTNISYAISTNSTILNTFRMDVSTLPIGALVFANETVGANSTSAGNTGTLMLNNGTNVTMIGVPANTVASLNADGKAVLGNGTTVDGYWDNGRFVVVGSDGAGRKSGTNGGGSQTKSMAALSSPTMDLHGGGRAGIDLGSGFEDVG
ncbi:hypothetical protein HDV00_009594 [Rhizophlyctis rosea]|nr:hypothetical protein HDV00_009594 [Rhizophlyctis rosea]